MADVDEAVALLHNVIQNVVAVFNEDGFTSSSEDDEEEGILIDGVFRPGDALREPVRIEGYLEHVIPRFDAETFQSHFRLTLPAYEALEHEIGPRLIQNQDAFGRVIPAPKQLLSVLWLLATPDSYRSVGERFNMSKSSLWACFQRVVSALVEVAPQVIAWPTPEVRQIYKTRFEQLSGIPNIIGAIDGTYCKIKAPTVDPQVYVTRKCTHAFTAQGICGPDLKFLDVFVGFPGSVHDTRIFRNSPIYQQVRQNREAFFDDNEFIIGDKAYPVLNWCIPPYINDGNLTRENVRFNRILSGQRSIIERTWALLFGRFRRLRDLDMNRTDWIPATILACCVLHNICLNFDPILLIRQYENEGRPHLNFPDDINAAGVFDANGGEQYRDYLCQLVNRAHV